MKNYNENNRSEIKLSLYNKLIKPLPNTVKRDIYDIPIIKKQDINIDKLNNGLFLLNFKNIASIRKNHNKFVAHYFLYDDDIQRMYDNPSKYLPKLGKFYAVITPDFSMYMNMDWHGIYDGIYKNRWTGAYCQSKGLSVIPSVGWASESTYDICFAGIEVGSIVAISTFGIRNNPSDFLKGYNEMRKRLRPTFIICLGSPIQGMNTLNVCFVSYQNTFGSDKLKYGWQSSLWDWNDLDFIEQEMEVQ